jgi:tetratricopeptide (TPR) repeat protein
MDNARQNKSVKRQALRGWLLVAAVGVGAATLGFLAARPFWKRDAGNQAPPDQKGPPSTPKDAFAGPAFSPEATVEDLKQEALRAAAELAKTYPDGTDALDLKARVERELGNSAEAVSLWERCVELDPGFAGAYYGLGSVAARQGEHQRAVPLLRKGLALAPSDARIPPLLGDALLKLGRVPEAIELLETEVVGRGKRGEPVSGAAVVQLGQAYLQEQDFDKAMGMFQSAIAANPNHKEAYYGAARAAARLQRKELSRKYMDRFKELARKQLRDESHRLMTIDHPGSTHQFAAQIHFEAGSIYLRHGSLPEAETMWRKAAVLDPENVECLTRLASLCEQNGQESEALRFCEQLCQMDPENPDYWLDVGLLRARLGRFDAGAEAVNKAIEIDPENPRYREAYRLIMKGE